MGLYSAHCNTIELLNRFICRPGVIRRVADRGVGLAAAAGIGARLVAIAQVVAVHVAQQHRVDAAEARVLRAAARSIME